MAKRELQRWQETAGDREPYASGKHSYLPSFKKTIPPDAVDQSSIFLFRVYKHGTLHLQRRYGYRKGETALQSPYSPLDTHDVSYTA